MSIFDWDENKNKWLKENRGLSFEQIIFCIENGQLIDVIRHPNQKRYKGQKMYLVVVDDYVYIVPFVENDGNHFLKTVFPSRKYTKRYKERGRYNGSKKES
jgi:uncharacterized DUF497 family protein